MNAFVFGVAAAVMLAGAPTFAQTPAPAPAQPTAPTAKPAPAPAQAVPAPPAKPFPEGARFAYVVLQRVANESADGKAASARIQALQQKRAAELNDKNKQLQGLQAKLEKEGSVMSATAQADLQKQAERINTDVQRFTQDAQQEIQDLQTQLQQQFESRVTPVLAQVGAEKGLHFIFNGPDSGLVWADPSLDISLDVIKKLDSTPSAPATTKPPVK
ncbi:MAG TPA: OmpH family outer membrane protein [Vicinamibacterales bacterium]|nr:OmpH family outer membrane protein [Vicinamibacterales bacterium]